MRLGTARLNKLVTQLQWEWYIKQVISMKMPKLPLAEPKFYSTEAMRPGRNAFPRHHRFRYFFCCARYILRHNSSGSWLFFRHLWGIMSIVRRPTAPAAPFFLEFITFFGGHCRQFFFKAMFPAITPPSVRMSPWSPAAQ
jgi:hypothetical protein